VQQSESSWQEEPASKQETQVLPELHLPLQHSEPLVQACVLWSGRQDEQCRFPPESGRHREQALAHSVELVQDCPHE
jgi:hypothetical protein